MFHSMLACGIFIKKRIILIFALLLVSASFLWAQQSYEEADELETILTAICEKTGQEAVTSFIKAEYNSIMGYIYMHVVLTKDRDNNFYYYRMSNVAASDGTLIFKESKQMTRREVEDYVQKNDPKILDDTMELGYKYYDGVVRTPNGNFYEFESCTNFYGLSPDNGWNILAGNYKYYKFESLKRKFVRNSKLDDLGFNDYEAPSSSYGSSSIAVGQILSCGENLRLRKSENTSSSIITTMRAGTRVRILQLGSRDTIDGISSYWVKVSVLSGGRDKDGRSIPEGTSGWCYGGFLK